MYNVYLEIASVCFLVLMLVLTKIKRQLNIYQNRLFSWQLNVAMLMNVADVVAFLLINYENSTPGKDVPLLCRWSATILSYSLQQILMQLFLAYFSTFTSKESKTGQALKIMSILSWIYGLLILSSPFTHAIFYFSEEGVYHDGSLRFLLFVIFGLFGLYGCCVAYVNRKRLSKVFTLGILACSVLTILLVVVQAVVIPHIFILYFWSTLVLVAVFMTLQSPDYYVDRMTNAFNHEGLTVVLKDRIQGKKPFAVLFVPIYDFANIKGGFSIENKRVVYNAICTKLFQIPNTEIFREDDKLYIFMYEAAKAEDYSMKIGKWLTDGIKVAELDEEVKIIAKMLMFDFPGRVSNEEEFYSVIKYFMVGDYYKHFNELEFINEEFFRKKKRYEDVRHLVEEAIRTEGIEIYYQPIYSTQKQDFHSAEALVRLKDKETIGFVSPDEFIPIAEKENLVLQLEQIILRKICSFVRREKIYNLGLQYIEINLSGNQCMQADLYEQLSELIEEYGISPKFLNFEVTETASIDNSEYLSRNMEQLRSYGSTFSLDDYGSGCSNLNYLVDYPFEIVKLDKGIVWTYFDVQKQNEKSRSVLPLSINMLREMNVRIVAEGIETEEQKNELIRMGVQYLQGYYFSKPISEMEFLQFLKEHNG